MEYQVLSRKYRPQNFKQIVGQQHVVNTLVNSINLNRIAHGYLLTGLRGVGKTTAARVFAKTLNCLSPIDNLPCEKCQNCIEIKESRSLDVLELDGASNRGIDEIREIKETVKYPPVSSKYKIFIIDEVHMLTKEAFNALLKTLEEPPENIIFILATTNAFKVPDTILSRTLRFDFKKFTNNQIQDHLISVLQKENFEYEDNAIEIISKKADGSMRDALSILDKIISYSNQSITYDLVKDSLGIIEEDVYLKLLKLIIDKNINEILAETYKVLDQGYDLNNFTNGFNKFLSNCLIYTSGYKTDKNNNDATKIWLDDNKTKVLNLDIMRMIDEINKYEVQSKFLLNPNIAFDNLLVKLAMMDQTVDLDQLINNLKDHSNQNQVDTNKIYENSSLKNENTKSKLNNQISDSNKSIEKKDVKVSKINTSKDYNIDNEVLSVTDNWNDILKSIKNKDKRLFSLLENAALLLDGNKLTFDLNDKGNDFIKRTLLEKVNIINDTINTVVKKRYDIKVKFNIKNDDKTEENHPLLDKIKNKFDGEIIK